MYAGHDVRVGVDQSGEQSPRTKVDNSRVRCSRTQFGCAADRLDPLATDQHRPIRNVVAATNVEDASREDQFLLSSRRRNDGRSNQSQGDKETRSNNSRDSHRSAPHCRHANIAITGELRPLSGLRFHQKR